MPLVTPDETITIALSVRDRHASARWYGETLGFQVQMHVDEAGWSELATNTPGVTLGLAEQADPAPGNSVPVFGVADARAARQVLEGAGVRLDGEMIEVEGMVCTFTFFDPDGNALMLAQDLSKG